MAMCLDSAFAKLRKANEEVPKPLLLPSVSELADLEETLNLKLHQDRRRYFLEVSDVVCGSYEPATITEPDDHTYWPDIVASARRDGVPNGLTPFCCDNGDYYCLDQAGCVRFWSHNGEADASWPNLAAWIEEAWLRDA